MKRCFVCGQRKSLNEFNRNAARKDGRNTLCRECQRSRYHENGDEERRKARRRNREYHYRHNWRQRAFDLLGAQCICCGEKFVDFLVVDHVEGGGREHRRKTGNGWLFYRWVVNHPEERHRVQVLCANCNMAKERGGCPRTKKHYRYLLKGESG